MTPSRKQQNTSRFNPFLATLLVLVAVIGTAVTLDATGTADLGLSELLWNREAKAADTVPVILSARRLQPGQQITRAEVWNPATQSLNRALMPISLVTEEHFATGFNDIVNRVLAVDKGAGEPFQPDDFMPRGTPPGPVGLVPAGMELLVFEADEVQGIETLGFRDRFDLKTRQSSATEIAEAAEEVLEALPDASPQDRMRLAAIPKDPEMKLVAQDGMIIRRPAMSGKKLVVAVALHPDDVDSTLEALAGDETVYCIARAGNAESSRQRVAVVPGDPVEPYRWLLDSMRQVELYQGNERSVEMVPVDAERR